MDGWEHGSVPDRGDHMALDRFSRMVQQFRLLSFQGPALLYEAGPLESALGWMLHTVMHGVVCEPFEFGSLGQHLDVLSVFQRW